MPKSSRNTLLKKVRAFFVHIGVWFSAYWCRIFGLKTPHKSLQLTERRDAVRPLVLPGYVSFTFEVLRTILSQKRVLFSVTLIFVLLYGILVGIGSQETYSSVVSLFRDSTEDIFQGVSGATLKSFMLFISITSIGFVQAPGEVQQVLAVLIFLMMWLSVVWLVRNYLAGKKVRVRDGLYSSGAPIFATIVVSFLIALQLIPIGLAVVGYFAAESSGLLAGGVEAMLFWVAAGFLGLLSLYWLISSLFAAIIITVPGTYPVWAMQTSSKMVFGRRGPLLVRVVWLGMTIFLTWTAVVPIAMFIDWAVKSIIPAISGLPVVPVVLLILMAWTALWSCVYMYLLYRKVVENESR